LKAKSKIMQAGSWSSLLF